MGNKKLFNVFENGYFKIYCQQVRQTRPNLGGGGLQRASQDSTKGGVAIIFYTLKFKISLLEFLR